MVKPGIFELVPENVYFGMDELIKSMLVWEKPVGKYHLQEVWLDIGQMPDYEAAQTAYKEHFEV